MSGRSYAEMMSRPSALRKPLLYTPASSRVRPASSPRRRQRPPLQTRLPAPTIADSPRRLLSYYLSKAAYNTHAEEDESDNAASATASDGDNAMSGWKKGAGDGQGAVSDELPPPPSYSSEFLRSPPSRSIQRNTGTSAAIPPPSPHCHPAGSVVPSASGAINVVTAIRQAEKSIDLSEKRTLAGSLTPLPPAPAAALSQSVGRAPSPTTPTLPMSHLTVYTEAQRRVFEEQVMGQVEALLQAQRSESHAELEAYRVTAAEAQATLQAVEEALGEQIGDMRRCNGGRAWDTGTCVHGRLDSYVAGSEISPTLKVLSPPPFTLSVDALTLEMSSVAAAAAKPATEQLLDAIMSIEEGQHVPEVLQQVMGQLYHNLARALVPSVVNYVNQQQELLHGQGTAAAVKSGVSVANSTGNGAPRDADELLRTHAEVAALQEEVHALRRTLHSRDTVFVNKDASSPNGLALPTSPIVSSNAQMHPSQEGLVYALQNRLFSECHAMLTRSRHEALLLRCSLEEEKRQHFLTRLRLLKPTHPLAPQKSSTAVSTADAADGHAERHNAPTSLGADRGGSDGIRSSPEPHSCSGSSPVMRGLSATRSPPSSVPDAGDSPRSQARATAVQSAGSLLSGVHHVAPRRWTPARSPLELASDSGRADEHDRDGDMEDNASVGHSPAPRHMPSRSSQLLSTDPNHNATRMAASLQAAMRVAEEVLHTTAPAAYTARGPAHPYYREESGGVARAWQHRRGSGGASAGSPASDDGALSSGRRGECLGQPPRARERAVSFLDPSDAFTEDVRHTAPPLTSERLAGTSSRSEPSGSSFTRVLASQGGNTSTSMDPISSSTLAMRWDGSAAATEAAPALPSDAYERRVWSKTVELLSRYSVA
nr:unnamed protein product [Leishmania braziliensis]